MSEYQYYEFVALDRPLDDRQLRDARAVSSRAEVSATRWVNEYNYGDFRGDPSRFVTDYFDAMVYLANWGTRRLMVSLPSDLVDTERLSLYPTGDALSVEPVGGKVVVDLRSETEDPPGWEDGSGWMDALAPVRRRLLGGDSRALYLGWLLGIQMGELEDDDVEPPVPAGLCDLPSDLEALVGFLRLDEDLLAVAAERSGERAERPEGLAVWIAALPDEEKTALLVEAAESGDGTVGLRLMSRFRREAEGDADDTGTAGAAGRRRTVEEIEAAADRRREERWAEERRKAEAERARRKAEAAARRERHLDHIEEMGGAAWTKVEELAGRKRPKEYALAVKLLKDLRDVAARRGAEPAWASQYGDLRDRHASKPAFLRRLDEAGLVSKPVLLRRLDEVPPRR